MKNFPTKVDSPNVGDVNLPAAEYNALTAELKNIVTSSGITLSDGDAYQLAKTVAIYAAGGDFYTDSGSANAYVLGVVGSKKAPSAYFDGMRVRFKAGNANTSASTVNVATLGVKNIKKKDGADLSADDIKAGYIYELSYDNSNGYFVLNNIYDERYYTEPEVDALLSKIKFYPTYCANYGNIDANGYADIIARVSDTEVSFKVGGAYPNMGVTFPNGRHYEISSIPNITGLIDNALYTFVIFEENLTLLEDGTYSATVTPIQIGYIGGISSIPAKSADSGITDGTGWTASASYAHVNYEAYKAVDRNTLTHYYSAENGVGWWKIAKDSGTFNLAKISIQATDTPSAAPKNFTIKDQANNVLATFTNQINWSNYETRTFDVVGNNISAVKIDVTATGSMLQIMMKEVKIFESYTGGAITENVVLPSSSQNGDLCLLINQKPLRPYLKQSSGWIEKQFVKLGEVTKDDGVILPADAISYAYNGKYTSPAITNWTNATSYNRNHNIGSKKITPSVYMECISADLGYVVDEEVHGIMTNNSTSDSGAPLLPVVNGNTTLNLRTGYGSPGGGVFITHNITSLMSGPTPSKWNIYVKAKRDF